MQHYFLCSAPDVIHLPHPSELIYWLQMLRHTFTLSHSYRKHIHHVIAFHIYFFQMFPSSNSKSGINTSPSQWYVNSIRCSFLCAKCLQFRLKEYHLLNTTSAIYHSPQMSQPPMLCYIREQLAKLTRWHVNLANVARVKCLHLTSRWRFPLNNTVLGNLTSTLHNISLRSHKPALYQYVYNPSRLQLLLRQLPYLLFPSIMQWFLINPYPNLAAFACLHKFCALQLLLILRKVPLFARHRCEFLLQHLSQRNVVKCVCQIFIYSSSYMEECR